jgi:hypothetical protein
LAKKYKGYLGTGLSMASIDVANKIGIITERAHDFAAEQNIPLEDVLSKQMVLHEVSQGVSCGKTVGNKITRGNQVQAARFCVSCGFSIL